MITGKQAGDGSPQLSPKLAGLSCMALLIAVTGCSRVEGMTQGDEYTWLWLIAPLVFYSVIGGLALYAVRVRQLKNWDLRMSPRAPTKSSMVWTLAGIAFVIWLIWVIYNFFVFDIDPRQSWLNSGMGLLGTVMGAALAALGGPFLAERSYNMKVGE